MWCSYLLCTVGVAMWCNCSGLGSVVVCNCMYTIPTGLVCHFTCISAWAWAAVGRCPSPRLFRGGSLVFASKLETGIQQLAYSEGRHGF